MLILLFWATQGAGPGPGPGPTPTPAGSYGGSTGKRRRTWTRIVRDEDERPDEPEVAEVDVLVPVAAVVAIPYEAVLPIDDLTYRDALTRRAQDFDDELALIALLQ